MSLKVNSFVRLSIYLNCSPYFITRLVLFFPPCTGTFFLPVCYANHIVGICLNCLSLLWNTLPASQYSRNCGSRGLPLSPFSPLCPRGPGGPGWPGGPAGPLAPRRTDSMLRKAQWWGWEEQARAHPSTGKGAAVQHKVFVSQDPWGCFLPSLTFGSWDAHLSLLPRRSWNGSISCKGEKVASD